VLVFTFVFKLFVFVVVFSRTIGIRLNSGPNLFIFIYYKVVGLLKVQHKNRVKYTVACITKIQ